MVRSILGRSLSLSLGGKALGGALAFAALGACAVTPAGASDANLAKARSQAAQGSSLFAERCASCHGDRGEGKAYAPSTMGAGALPLYPRDASTSPTTTDPALLQLQSQKRPPGVASRNPFRTAQDLSDYLGQHLPAQNQRPLNPEELRAVVSFVLVAHGSQVPSEGVTPDNAGKISI